MSWRMAKEPKWPHYFSICTYTAGLAMVVYFTVKDGISWLSAFGALCLGTLLVGSISRLREIMWQEEMRGIDDEFMENKKQS